MEQPKEYFAFISYKREDEKWAKWLQQKLEHYKFPTNLNGRTDLPKHIRPVFKDTSELSAGVLAEEIKAALDQSKYLIVICSPNASRSKWVNKEVQLFIDSGRANRIIPFIIDGTPNCADSEKECFPLAIRELPEAKELLGVDIREMGRDVAAVKVVAHMFGLNFDTLWQRHEKENKRKWILWIVGAVAIALTGTLISINFFIQNNTLLINQSKFLAEKAQTIAQENSFLARRLAVYALPSNLSHPNRPYVTEAESALRTAFRYNTISYKEPDEGNYITSVKFSQDGSYVVYGTEYGAIKKWDAKTGVIDSIPEIGRHMGRINAMAFSPDGQRLVSCSGDGKVILWSLSQSEHSHLVIGDKRLPINDVIFSPDGTQLISGGKDGSIDIWGVKSRKLLRSLTGHNSDVSCIGISSDGNMLVSGSFDKTLILWDMRNDSVIRKLVGHDDRVLDVAFSPDRKLIASASADKKVKIWDVKSGVELRMLEGHLNEVTSVMFSPDGARIVTGSNDGQIKVWDAFEGKELQTLSQDYHRITSVAFSPDGRKIVSGSTSRSVKIWETETKSELRIYEAHNYYVSSVAFSPDGNQIASGSADRTVKIWDAYTCALIQTLAVVPRPVRAIAYSPSGDILAVGTDDGKLQLFKVSTGESLYDAINAHDDWLSALSFSPDGRRIVTCSYDKSIKIWDVNTGSLLLGLVLAHTEWITDVTFSPDGRCFASCSYDRNIKIWDAKSGKNTLTFKTYHEEEVSGLSFSPDGKRLASCSADRTIMIWDIKHHGKHILSTPKSHNAKICSISFNTNKEEDIIVSGSSDNLIKVWNAKTGKEIQSFNGHGDWVLSVAFSHDGRRIVSGAADNSIRIWDFPPCQELIDSTRNSWKGHEILSDDEKATYNID